MSMILCS